MLVLVSKLQTFTKCGICCSGAHNEKVRLTRHYSHRTCSFKPQQPNRALIWNLLCNKSQALVLPGSLSIASFPGPSATFGCTKERGGPGISPHVCDVKSRKVVERT